MSDKKFFLRPTEVRLVGEEEPMQVYEEAFSLEAQLPPDGETWVAPVRIDRRLFATAAAFRAMHRRAQRAEHEAAALLRERRGVLAEANALRADAKRYLARARKYRGEALESQARQSIWGFLKKKFWG